MAMWKQRIPDGLATRIPSRYYTISYFLRRSVMRFYDTFIISVRAIFISLHNLYRARTRYTIIL